MTRRAFTLVELVVVIGVILLLVGLTLSVSVAVIEQSERRETENVLRLLDMAMKEWEVTTDRKLSWWDHFDSQNLKDQTDIHADTKPILIITEMLDVIQRPAPVKEIIALANSVNSSSASLVVIGFSPAWSTPKTLKKTKSPNAVSPNPPNRARTLNQSSGS